MRPTSSAPTLSTPLVATLTAAAAGRPPSLAATVIAPQSCCVAAMPAQCGSIQRSAPTRTPFLERRILPIRRVWRHVCISLESRLNGPKAPKFPAARTSRLEFRGADRSPEGALPVLFLIPHGNGTLFHFFSRRAKAGMAAQDARRRGHHQCRFRIFRRRGGGTGVTSRECREVNFDQNKVEA